jgi:Tol biopolymer transport system component
VISLLIVLFALAAEGEITGLVTDPREVHLANVQQLTFGGENAEAYWSADGKRLIFQSKHGDMGCDQIFTMNADGHDVRRVSNGDGRCTCSYFFPDGKRVLYASTQLAAKECPPPPDYSKGYIWKLYAGYEIFTANPDGSDIQRITNHPGYDAEATISPDGATIVFTSLRDGDLDLYTMRPDGSKVKRITKELGYDGGAFFSRDGKRLVWRASRPKGDGEIAAYRELLAHDEIKPMTLELYVGDADGKNARQVTHNGAANFGPYFFPDGKRIIFASNSADPKGRDFDLWIVNDDGTGLERVTYNDSFDGFPMFSPDGKKLVFASNRNGKERGETNLFLADWK